MIEQKKKKEENKAGEKRLLKNIGSVKATKQIAFALFMTAAMHHRRRPCTVN